MAYTNYSLVLHQARQLPPLGIPPPQPSCSIIGGNVDGLKGDLVGFQDCLEAGGGGDDVRGARGEGGVEVEGGICHVFSYLSRVVG